MALIAEWDAKTQKKWDKWVATRPPAIQEMCRRYPPNRLYRMTDTGQRCTLAAYAENGTVRVQITGKYNLHSYDREVFGVDPEKLVECDLPPPGEAVGTMLNNEETEEYIGAQIARLHRNGERHNEARCPLCKLPAPVETQ